jgi:hypothetical protein
MLCTLVIDIGTLPYFLRPVAIPWVINPVGSFYGLLPSMVFCRWLRLGDGRIHFFCLRFSCLVWRYSVIVHLRWYLMSYAVQAWGLLWCFYPDGLSEQQHHIDYTGACFQVWQFEFPSRLIFNPWIWRSVVQHSPSQMGESRSASDRSSLRIERAYFTQLAPCCDNSDDVFDIMVFKIFSMNLSRNLSWRYALVAESFFLIRDVNCVVAWYAFLSHYKTLLDLSRQIGVLLLRLPWL